MKLGKAFFAAVLAGCMLTGNTVCAGGGDALIAEDDFGGYQTGVNFNNQKDTQLWGSVYTGEETKMVDIAEDEENPDNGVLRIWNTGTNATAPWATLNISDTKDSKMLISFRFKGAASGAGGRIMLGTGRKYIGMQITDKGEINAGSESGTYVPLDGCTVDVEKWNNFALLIDTAEWTADIYIEGVYAGRGLVRSTADGSVPDGGFGLAFIGELKKSSNGDMQAAYYDDIRVVKCIGNKASLVIDGATAASTGEITGTLHVPPAGGDLSSITVRSDSGAAASIGSIEYSGGKLRIVFSPRLEPDTGYTVSMGGLTDMLGRPIEDVSFKTREAALTISQPELYLVENGRDILLNTLKAGTLKGEINVSNEKAEDYSITLIAAVYDTDGTMIAAASSSALVEAYSDEKLTAQLDLADASGCTMKLFVWDSFKDRNTLNCRRTFEWES